MLNYAKTVRRPSLARVSAAMTASPSEIQFSRITFSTSSGEESFEISEPHPASSKPKCSIVKEHVLKPPKHATSAFHTFVSPQILDFTNENASSIAPSSPEAASQSSSESAETNQKGEMPTYDYRDYSTPQPTVHYCRRTDEVDEHVAKLKGATIGLDLEWKVLLRRTMIHGRVAVVQVADAERIIIAHVHHMDRFPIRLRELIESKSTAKVGANILNDGKKLFADWGIIPNALVELGSVAQTVDPKSANASFGKRKVVSLSRLTAKYCNKHLDKGSDRTSNWEVERLSTSQLHYAANDVHASVQIFQAITNDLSSETLPLTLANLSIRAGDDLNDLPLDDTVPISPPPVFGSRMFAGEVLTPVMEDAGMRSQFLRAYREWHWKHCDVWDMATRLSLKGTGEPLKVSTVISYIVQALTIDKKLPFDMGRLRLLLLCDEGSWVRHKNWVIQAWQEGRGRRKTRPAGSKLNKVPE